METNTNEDYTALKKDLTSKKNNDVIKHITWIEENNLQLMIIAFCPLVLVYLFVYAPFSLLFKYIYYTKKINKK